jgi:hypothetical protein
MHKALEVAVQAPTVGWCCLSSCVWKDCEHAGTGCGVLQQFVECCVLTAFWASKTVEFAAACLAPSHVQPCSE